MGNLFGHKKWYKVDKIIKDKKGKESTIKQEVRIKRNYSVDRYTLNTNNKEKNNINNEDFVNQFIEYKTNNDIFKKFTRKFHMGNILFKLKGNKRSIEDSNDFLKTEEVVLDKEIYGQSEKLRNEKGITKKNILKEINNQKIDNSVKKISMNTNSGKTIVINFSDKLKKDKDDYQITLNIISEDELERKRKIYDIFKMINMDLYQIIKEIIENEVQKVFKNRYYEEHLREKLLKDDKIDVILTNFMKIREKIESNPEIMGFVKFYLNVGGDKKKSENKKMLVEKILNINVDLTVEDIVDFIIGELKFYGIIKRIEKLQEKTVNRTDEDVKNTYKNTYVLLDKHEKFKKYNRNPKDIIVKSFIKDIKDNTMEQKINQILKKFKIDELIKKTEKELKRGNCDTEIFGIFKVHYQEMFSSEKFEKKSDEEKELYKIIYRYLKGRIEKILVNEQKVRLKKMEKIEVEKILNESILSEKILKRVKQYTLEHIMYLGKLRHNDIDMTTVNTDDFSRLHAKEELDLELITFFASTNMELNKIFSRKNINNDGNIDFFGGDGKKNYILDKKISNSKIEIIRKLDFIDNKNDITNNFIEKFIKIGTNERNRILHASSKKRDLQGTQDDYNKVINIIQNLKISDEEVSKALNLDVVFKNKKDIITKINDIKISEENSNDIKYLPSFSKILPEILNLYRNNPKNEPFDTIETEKIVLNALIYVNKELYKKLILEDDLEENGSKNIFLQELKKTLGNIDEIDENIIENYYKNAQISASKGNNKAIKKYQKKIIECYIEYLRKNYEKLFDFSDFEMNIQEIKKQIKEINDNKTYKRITIKTSDKSIVINNDFEYIISIFALLNSNTYINKIRNRFFATSVWLNTQKYENIIDILDKILSINLLRENNIADILDLKNTIIEAKIVENNEECIRNYIFENSEEELKKRLFCEELINKKGIRKIFEDKNFKFKNFIKKTRNENFTINFDILFNLECNSELNVKKVIGQNSQRLNLFIKNTIDEYKSKIKTSFSSEFLEKYKGIIDNLIENENKFEKIYYPEKNKNKLYTYKKNLFWNIGNPNFDKIYGLISNDIKVADAKFLFDSDGEDIRNNKISEIDAILKNLNDKLNGYSKEYKEKYIKKLKENNDFFKKNIQNENYNSFKEFKEDYTKSYYNFKDYQEFMDICSKFGIDLSENSEINKPENESIRNYISHFYIVRNPFADYSIAEQIDRVSNLLSYSTRYNNSTYASVFEVFKKDVNLDYDKLKTKFKLFDDEKNDNIKILKIENLIESKKVSVLELESYNSDYVKNLIIELLTKIENTNDTL